MEACHILCRLYRLSLRVFIEKGAPLWVAFWWFGKAAAYTLPVQAWLNRI